MQKKKKVKFEETREFGEVQLFAKPYILKWLAKVWEIFSEWLSYGTK